jgi:hypothetical protein
MMPLYLGGDPNSCSDVGAGKHRYAQAERILSLSQNHLFVVCGDKVINKLDVETRLHQGRGQTKERERSPERGTVVRWVEEHDFVLRRQSVSVSTRRISVVGQFKIKPNTTGLPDVRCHGLRSFECKTVDPTNCQNNVKSVSFLMGIIALAVEDFADLLQI